MDAKGKILVTDEGHFDLTSYEWDDQLFSDILIQENKKTPLKQTRPWISADF